MTIEDFKETAAMAHLNMDEKELAGIFPAFEEVLALFASVQAAENDKAAFSEALPPASPTDLAGVFGNSRIVDSRFYRSANLPSGGNSSPDLNEKMLNNAGERDGRFLMVPNVL